MNKTLVTAAAAAVVALAIGGTGGALMAQSDPADSAEYVALQDDLDAAESELSDATRNLAMAERDIPDREAAVTAKEAELDERAATVKAKERDLARREKAVGIVEAEIARNTIPGDGIFEVGVDMKAGKYKMAGADCYYAVNGDANGDNIISNNNVNGPAVVEVRDGQYFETSRCDDWVLQR